MAVAAWIWAEGVTPKESLWLDGDKNFEVRVGYPDDLPSPLRRLFVEEEFSGGVTPVLWADSPIEIDGVPLDHRVHALVVERHGGVTWSQSEERAFPHPNGHGGVVLRPVLLAWNEDHEVVAIAACGVDE